MDCRTALQKLEAARPDSGDLDEPDFAEAAAHLRDHPHCAELFRRRQEFDKVFGQRMRDVAIPAGLKERLLQSLEPQPAVEERPALADFSRDRQARRRWLVLGPLAAVAACLLAAVLVWFLFPEHQPPLSVGDLRELAKAAYGADASLPAFNGTAEPPPLPGFGWRSGAIRIAATPRSPASGAGRNVVAIYAFALSGGNIEGMLIAAPRESVQDPPQARYFSGDSVRYEGPFSFVSWTEDEWVYVCLVRGGGAVDQLQRALHSAPAA